MARKKNEPLIVTAIRKNMREVLAVRPDGARTMRELCLECDASEDVVRRQINALRKQGVLRTAYVKDGEKSVFVYWTEQNKKISHA